MVVVKTSIVSNQIFNVLVKTLLWYALNLTYILCLNISSIYITLRFSLNYVPWIRKSKLQLIFELVSNVYAVFLYCEMYNFMKNTISKIQLQL